MRIYLIAGEPSGDLLGSGLMQALLKAEPGVQFRGLGGESMTACGLKSRFDIAEISVMGLFEVLPRLPLILRRIRETVEDIKAWQPDVIVTIDSWGFVSSLIGKLRKQGVNIPVVHYVAPQVWAWKKGRAKNVARLVDRLMMLLPGEEKYFEPYGLQCDFVGHPVIERMNAVHCNGEAFRRRHAIPPDARVLCVLPGSRQGEIDKLGPILKESLDRIWAVAGDFYVVVPTVAAMEESVRRVFADLDIPVCVVTGSEERYDAFCVSEIALAKSGTVSLELAALSVPHLILYKFNALTNVVAKALVKISYANLINILSGREIIPEFVLLDCRADRIAPCALKLLESPEAAAEQVAQAQAVLQTLRLPDILPSERAAQVVLEEGRKGR